MVTHSSTSIYDSTPKTPRAAGWHVRRRIALAVVGIPHLGLCAALIVAMVHGVRRGHLLVALCMYLVTAIGIEVGFHRLFSHRAFRTSQPVRFVFAFLGSMAGQGPAVFWAGIHRRHHAHADGPEDPHTPCQHPSGFRGTLRGLWHAHVGWLFTTNIPDSSRTALDLVRDPAVGAANRMYPVCLLAGLAIPAALGAWIEPGAWGLLQGLLWGGFTRVCMGQHTTWSVNSFGHLFGAQPFASNDSSRNSWILSVVYLGGSLHNNHHAFPFAASTRLRWWEVDIGGIVVWTLVRLGLADQANAPSEAIIDARRRMPTRAVEGS